MSDRREGDAQPPLAALGNRAGAPYHATPLLFTVAARNAAGRSADATAVLRACDALFAARALAGRGFSRISYAEQWRVAKAVAGIEEAPLVYLQASGVPQPFAPPLVAKGEPPGPYLPPPAPCPSLRLVAAVGAASLTWADAASAEEGAFPPAPDAAAFECVDADDQLCAVGLLAPLDWEARARSGGTEVGLTGGETRRGCPSSPARPLSTAPTPSPRPPLPSLPTPAACRRPWVPPRPRPAVVMESPHVALLRWGQRIRRRTQAGVLQGSDPVLNSNRRQAPLRASATAATAAAAFAEPPIPRSPVALVYAQEGLDHHGRAVEGTQAADVAIHIQALLRTPGGAPLLHVGYTDAADPESRLEPEQAGSPRPARRPPELAIGLLIVVLISERGRGPQVARLHRAATRDPATGRAGTAPSTSSRPARAPAPRGCRSLSGRLPGRRRRTEGGLALFRRMLAGNARLLDPARCPVRLAGVPLRPRPPSARPRPMQLYLFQ
eukprot:tig00001160_g7341.t1